MASPDVFMSSPSRRRALDPISISSSSPCLPSLDEIFLNKAPNKPPLRAERRPTSIPAGAQVAFTSAASILREAPEIDIDTETITSSPPRRCKIIGKTHARMGPAADISPSGQGLNETGTLIGSQSPTTPTTPKLRTDRNQPNNVRETVSRHFTTRVEDSLPGNEAESKKGRTGAKELVGEVIANIELGPVVHRRTDWTPPKANEPVMVDSDSDSRELFSSFDKGPPTKDVFQTLHSQFGRHDSEIASELYPHLQTEVLGKRKRIELISTGRDGGRQQTPEELPSKDPQRLNEQKKRAGAKAPAPKKKIRTITELAIAPFAVPAVPGLELDGPASKESMLDYFDSDGVVKALVEHQSVVMSQRKPNAKETKLAPKKTRKRKTGTQANPILLSPNSALKQSSNQDFVFGTSSQLMREESPTMLRDLQAAIRASDSLNSDPFDDEMGKRLWRAGARDEDGELISMEVVDLQNGPVPMIQLSSTATPGCRSFVDIDDLLDSPQPVSPAHHVPTPVQSNSHFIHSQVSNEDLNRKPPELEVATNVTNSKPHPNYELFTDSQLAKQISSYGFKPVKKRAAMIALLDQCWASKHQGTSATLMQPLSTSSRSTALAQQKSAHEPALNKSPSKPHARGRPKKDSDTTKSVPEPSVSETQIPKQLRRGSKKDETASTNSVKLNPKRPRGRPRKSSTASIEIPNSDDSTPSPILSSDSVFSSPPPLDLTVSDEGDMSLMMPLTDQQADLFRHITKAVISAPRSQDPSKPSWHEKMLLYDPIILEDLASWLNGGELTRVGYNKEISPSDVKTWCESKSVICLWRQNTRGKERKRY
ncbi:putative structure-specific endonuclease subunit SLX4 [Rosellinia necatrix]|uniref:Structure-specific endonuclease subunit SLX4 n=1 Tax=Rosellinia necatrix TaxID=77044 RepID=A0A1W2TIZ6_ROSNE|nr:putative structure-specific endonuclease subunit SLX4 [Rosellinia necatrix]